MYPSRPFNKKVNLALVKKAQMKIPVTGAEVIVAIFAESGTLDPVGC
jgi:hypothetical protein